MFVERVLGADFGMVKIHKIAGSVQASNVGSWSLTSASALG
jgi:hypothetical protein